MIIKSKIVRDTVMLTIMQLFLDSAALLLNVFITKRLGTSAIGVISLTGSFLALAGTVSNGNAFLCTSRLISEELGRRKGDPERVLLDGILMCMILSTAVSGVLFLMSDFIGLKFFKSPEMSKAVSLMPFALIPGAAAACFKGYFNALRKSSVTAAADIMEFAVRSSVIITGALKSRNLSDGAVCSLMITSIMAGSCFSLLFFSIMFIRSGALKKKHKKASISFAKYISLAFPIMVGGILTSALSSTNDALIPVTLRQFGSSVSEAFSSFGIFEAIVIPAIFFPSVVLCSMSGIIVSESARAAASGDHERIKSLTSRLIKGTLIFALLAAAMLMRFGNIIGETMGGGSEAGRIITVIAPVVPFIYLEIVLEALIKGMGLQGFSSLNYLAEYAVRISVVLIFIPRIGFYGIVLSYYASNILGNSMRLIKLLRHTGVRLGILCSVVAPIAGSVLAMGAADILARLLGLDTQSLFGCIFIGAVWCSVYFAGFLLWRERPRAKMHLAPPTAQMIERT